MITPRTHPAATYPFQMGCRERAFKTQAWRVGLPRPRTAGLTSLRRPGSREPLLLLEKRWKNQIDVRSKTDKMTAFCSGFPFDTGFVLSPTRAPAPVNKGNFS